MILNEVLNEWLNLEILRSTMDTHHPVISENIFPKSVPLCHGSPGAPLPVVQTEESIQWMCESIQMSSTSTNRRSSLTLKVAGCV